MKPCVEWHMARVGGYGVYGRRGEGRAYVHRMVCEFFHGPPPPGKPFALHSCDNRACYEPSHLRWGSSQDNSDDMVNRGRAPTGDRNGSRKHPETRPRGSRHPAAKFTEEQVLYVREQLRAGRTQQSLADEFGVRQQAISWLKSGKTWTHLTQGPQSG
jgi:hypothetical protein